MEFARLDISESEAARRIGISQDKISRRMSGKNPFNIDELEELCDGLGISFDYVTTGIRALPTPPNDGLQLPRKDSNLQPFDETSEPTLAAAASF